MKNHSIILTGLTISIFTGGCINSNNTDITIERKKIDATVSCVMTDPSPGNGDEEQYGKGSDFLPTKANSLLQADSPPENMVRIPGGEFSMGVVNPSGIKGGGHEPMEDARPVHRVYVDGFYMDATEVTNAQFAAFVHATGYRTVAEQRPTREEFPGAPEENLVAGSIVFDPPSGPVPLNDHYQWWRYIAAADWQHPAGPESTVKGKDNYPVVQIAWEDAAAYAKWSGKRLPTEAEWEFASRGGNAGKLYGWGNQLKPEGRWMANTFQGHFPNNDAGEDGYQGAAPVKQYPANGYGLYDMEGNVWEWCSDWYRADYYRETVNGKVASNPKGPVAPYDPAEPEAKKKVQRGGSFLCTDQYCTRYILGTRGKGEWRSGANHIGFRCVRDVRTLSQPIASKHDVVRPGIRPVRNIHPHP